MSATFDELGIHPRLIENLLVQSISSATDVQEAALPVLMDGRDALVCAETGTGKTLAYLLPTMQLLLEDPEMMGQDSPHCLVLLPTRELADQVFKQAEALAQSTGARCCLISGGQEFRYQAAVLRRNPDIVVATPGRLAEHLARKSLDLSDVQCLVLDEADRMLDMGFREEVLAIASHIEGVHQSVMLSATLKHKGISAIAGRLLNEPEKILLSSAREVNKNVSLQMILADDPAHKVRLLLWLLANEPFAKALVFVKTRESTERVAAELASHNHRVRYLHGEITQDSRRKIMAGFREGRFKIMVATDVAARGLDVFDLDLVVNFDMAHSGEEFVHRAGRTGRAGQTGLMISLVAAPEWNLSAGIQRYLGVTFERRKISGLEASYKGPKKVKASGKAAGTKKKAGAGKGKKAAAGKSRKASASTKDSASRGKTNTSGRSRGRSAASTGVSEQGFAPLKKPVRKVMDED